MKALVPVAMMILGAALLSVVAYAQMSPEVMSMLQAQVDQACGPDGDRNICGMAKKNLELAKSTERIEPSTHAVTIPPPTSSTYTQTQQAVGNMVPFPSLPEGHGSPDQRARYVELCEGKTFAIGSGGGMGCTQTYQFLMGQIKLPNAVAGGPMNHPPAPRGANVARSASRQIGGVTTSGSVKHTTSQGPGGTCMPVNPKTEQACITMVGQTVKDNGSYRSYDLKFKNSCDIIGSIRGVTNEGKELGTGISKYGESSVTCTASMGCTGFSSGYAFTSSCH